jgi:hypothetical protein
MNGRSIFKRENPSPRGKKWSCDTIKHESFGLSVKNENSTARNSFGRILLSISTVVDANNLAGRIVAKSGIVCQWFDFAGRQWHECLPFNEFRHYMDALRFTFVEFGKRFR